MDTEKLRNEIISRLQDHIEQIFYDLQKKMGIEDGNISPYDALELDHVMKEMSARMEIILLKQK